MLTIRLRRVGAKKKPHYRVVVIESSVARDGRFVENLGHYDPCVEPELFQVKPERVAYWVSKGARLSDTVRTLLVRNSVESTGTEAAEQLASPVEKLEKSDGDETQVST